MQTRHDSFVTYSFLLTSYLAKQISVTCKDVVIVKRHPLHEPQKPISTAQCYRNHSRPPSPDLLPPPHNLHQLPITPQKLRISSRPKRSRTLEIIDLPRKRIHEILQTIIMLLRHLRMTHVAKPEPTALLSTEGVVGPTALVRRRRRTNRTPAIRKQEFTPQKPIECGIKVMSRVSLGRDLLEAVRRADQHLHEVDGAFRTDTSGIASGRVKFCGAAGGILGDGYETLAQTEDGILWEGAEVAGLRGVGLVVEEDGVAEFGEEVFAWREDGMRNDLGCCFRWTITVR